MIKNKKLILILAVLALIVAGALLYVFVIRNDQKSSQQSATQESTVNLNPPTEQEKKAAEDNKKQIDIDQSSRQNQTTNGTKAVKPLITYVDSTDKAVQISSYVPGIFEEGGSCKATFTKETRTVTKTVIATREGSATFCPLIVFNSSEFLQKGSWSLSILYSSPTATGTSDAKQVEIK